jgi:two-component system KDP operon response regulator KdpE
LKILIVDDDSMVQQVCQGMLRALKHTAVGVVDAVEAIQYLTAASQEFDVVILDNGLPGLSGMELFAVLREWNMSIPVILISGARPVLDGDENAAASPKFQFLAKPFTLANLQAAIERSQE